MHTIARLNASLTGRYTIERELGAGGMATVYLAHDLKHDRDVAIKVLHPELAIALGGDRFLSEIRTTAKLQHPHILPLLDSGSADGLLYYVMPLVAGESLRARLERERQLPIEDAVRIASEVAGALDYAHRHGVIHRDIKPENILLHDGSAMVADFGIALAVQSAGGQRMTQTGLSLGTPQYMSPEQAMGERSIDARSDIYALGAVTYEMLAGEPPFTGATVQAIVAKVLTSHPEPVTTIRRNVSPQVAAAVHRSLEKLPADRFATAAQFVEALHGGGEAVSDYARFTGASPAGARERNSAIARTLPWIAALAGLGAAIAAIALRPAPAPEHLVRFDISTSSVTFDPSRASLAVSPDGSRIAYATGTQLWVRDLATSETRALPGTEGASFVFFSPDGAWIGYQATGGPIRKVSAAGGQPITIGPSIGRSAASWGFGNIIVYSSIGLALRRISSEGGAAQQFAALDSAHGETWQRQPSFLPDGHSVIYVSRRDVNDPRNQPLVVTTLDGRATLLSVDGTNPFVTLSGFLFFANPSGAVSAVPFDLRAQRVTGTPVQVLDGVFVSSIGSALIGLSRDGNVLAYVSNLPPSRLALVGADGEPELLPGESRRYRHVRVSPDGTRIAVDVLASDGSQDVWIHDVRAGSETRLTLDGRSSDPVWNPDGKRIAFTRNEGGANATDVYEVPADGSQSPHPLLVGPGMQFASAWHPNGRDLFYDEISTGSQQMHVSRLDAGGKRSIVAETPGYSVRLPAVSPDGRWLAYASNESGRYEVYARALDGTGRWPVSIGGGNQPVWSRDGRTLYYRSDTHIMAASVAPGAAFTIVDRKPFVADRFSVENTVNYDAMPDGKRLAVIVPSAEAVQIHVVVGWMAEVRKRLAATGVK